MKYYVVNISVDSVNWRCNVFLVEAFDYYRCKIILLLYKINRALFFKFNFKIAEITKIRHLMGAHFYSNVSKSDI